MSDSNSILGSIAKSSTTQTQRQIIRYYLQNQARALLPEERVAQCHRAMRPFSSHVEIYSEPDVKRAYYRNLVVCARVWQCPVCAARISEHRRRDLQEGMDRIQERSALLTYTLQHTSKDSLEVLLKALLDAFTALKEGRFWTDFVRDFGWIGSIRALEVTVGKNGWHPHLHEIGFVGPSLELSDFDEMKTRLAARWRVVLQKQGRDASYEFGMTIKPTYSSVAEYVAKWGHDPVDDTWSAAREIAKASSKQASPDGLTPFQLLKNFGAGDKKAGFFFQEYVRVFKHKQQLIFPAKLRKKMGYTEPDLGDDEAAEKIPPTAIMLASLSMEQWRVILRKDLRGQLLEVAAKGDSEELWDWLNGKGITMTVEVNIEEFMWQEYEKKYGKKNQETKKTPLR